MLTPRLRQLHDDIAYHGAMIALLFACPMKVTIIARNPDNPEQEVCVTSDTWEGIEGSVARAKVRESAELSVDCKGCGHPVKVHSPGGCAGAGPLGTPTACACAYVSSEMPRESSQDEPCDCMDCSINGEPTH